MISQTAEYALRAMTFLALRERTVCTNTEIAKATLIPVGYLAKVMQALTRARIVRSQRGLNGGFTFHKDPAEVSLLEIIDAVDPIRRFHECPFGLETHVKGLCRLHGKLDEAGQALAKIFGEATVAQLLETSDDKTSGCTFPIVDSPKP